MSGRRLAPSPARLASCPYRQSKRAFKTKWFARFARKQRIGNEALLDAIDRLRRGLVDADLGGHLFKQRLPRSGQGRSGGFRTVIVYKRDERAIFVFGFLKSDRDTLSQLEEAAYKQLAIDLLAMTDADLNDRVADGLLTEIDLDG